QPVDEPGDREREKVEVEPLPERRSAATNAATCLADAAAEGDEARADARRGRSDCGERDADPEGGQDAPASDPARRACELDRAERDGGADRPGAQPERGASQRGEPDEVAPPGAARTHQGEAAPVALGRPERRQIGKTERHQRTWD